MTAISTTTRAPTPGVTLSRELADFLIELSIALSKHSIYPPGHPLLEATIARVVRRLAPLLIRRRSLTIGVGREQLLIDDAATDPSTGILRDLAERLRRRDVAALRIQKGITADELSALLQAIGRDQNTRAAEPLDPAECNGPHLEVVPVNFRRIALAEPSKEEQEREGRVKRLWVELARAALGPAFADLQDPENADGLVVARAIRQRPGNAAQDSVVASYLRQIAKELKHDGGTVCTAMRAQISSLIGALDGQSLERLVQLGQDDPGNEQGLREFLLEASQWLAADAVVALVQAAAAAKSQAISNSMLRLLHKMALHVRRGTGEGRATADAEVRERVQRMVNEWSLEDPNPEDHAYSLDAFRAVARPEQQLDPNAAACEPERIVMIALEIEDFGPEVLAAVRRAIDAEMLAPLANIADGAPTDGAREWLWTQLATLENLRMLLAAPAVDLPLLERFVARMGLAAAEPMLDALEWSEERTTRRRLVEMLAQLGPAVGPLLASRFEGAPWFVQRNLLLIMGKLESWPPAFDPETYAAHEDPRVRREAIKLLLSRSAETRDIGIRLGVADSDVQVMRLALTAATSSCPPQFATLLVRRLDGRTLAAEVRTLAIRALAATRANDGLQWMVRHGLRPRRWYRRTRLVPKSPELLAVIAGLAAHWSTHELAQPLLERARKSRDTEIRAAAAGRVTNA